MDDSNFPFHGVSMLSKLKHQIRSTNRSLSLFLMSAGMALAIWLNLEIIGSPVIGIVAFLIFFIINGLLLGQAFFQNETFYFKLAFGVLSLIMLFLLIGASILVFLRVNIGFVSILTVFLAMVTVIGVHLIFAKKNESGNEQGSEKIRRSFFSSLLYVPYAILSGYLLFQLFSTRSSWVYGSIWDVLPGNFLLLYFFSTLTLLGLVFSQGRIWARLSLIVIHSVISLFLFILVVESALPLYDPWVHLGNSATLSRHGSTTWSPFRSLADLYYLIAENGLPIFVSILSGIFTEDIFWPHVLSIPIIWGAFVPLIAYKITELIGGDDTSRFLSAFLAVFTFNLIWWATVSESDSLAYIFLFFSIFLTLRYLSSKDVKTTLIAIVAVVATLVTDPLPGVLSVSFLTLAWGLKKCCSRGIKNFAKPYVFLSFLPLFIGSIFLVPLTIVLRGRLSPSYGAMYGFPAFSIEKLFQTDVWHLIFGEIIDSSLKNALLSETSFLLGVVGLGYALAHRKKHNTTLILFLLFALIITILDYTILEDAMVNVPVSPGRIFAFRDFVILPFTGITLVALINQFPSYSETTHTISGLKEKLKIGSRINKRIIALILLAVFLSSVALAVVYENYAYRRGLQVTGFEMNVVEYIDEHTPEKYVVIAEPRLWSIGIGHVGFWNLDKLYVYSKESKYDRIDGYPSVENMLWAMGRAGARIGYFFAVSYRTPNYHEVVEKASLIFRPYAIFSEQDLEIRIFRYELPRLTSSDVTTFYWDLPPTYFIQNDLMQVSISPLRNQLEVRDHYGTLYEGVDFNETLLDGSNIGNMTSIEYFVPDDSKWVRWNSQETVPYSLALSQQFRFKLNFEKGSLIGVVERGKPFLQILQESGQNFTIKMFAGDFTRLYIPGLIGGPNSYNVSAQPFGLLYTTSRTSGIILHPAYKYEVNASSLTLNEIKNYCKLNVTQGYMWYDLYVHNNASEYQWAYIEVWLPDRIDEGMFPLVSYSTDKGETWVPASWPSRPIKTLGGVEVNWVITRTPWWGKKPVTWIFYGDAAGGSFTLPEDFTDSGGGENRFLFGLYLPAQDKALLRIGPYIYRTRPVKLTYVFRDTYEANYGLRNMNDNFIAIYNDGSDVYAGGFALSKRPLLLAISEDETGIIKSISATVPSNVTLSLLAAKDLDTTLDLDEDGVPDIISGLDRDTVRVRAHESKAILSYEIQDFPDGFALRARINYLNEWESPFLVTICVPYELRNDGGILMFEKRGLSKVLRASILNNETETIRLYKT